MRHMTRFCVTLTCTVLMGQASFGGGPIQPPTPPPPVLPPVGTPGPVFVPPIGVSIPTATESYTQSVARQLANIQNFCRRVPATEYTVDCLRDQLEQVASQMPSSGDYAEARDAIAGAAAKLRKLVRDNASQDLPSGRIQTPDGSERSGSALVPVRTDRVAQVNTSARAIMQEAETVLLRSAASSTARKTHYQTIAQAFGSNKVLLRS